MVASFHLNYLLMVLSRSTSRCLLVARGNLLAKKCRKNEASSAKWMVGQYFDFLSVRSRVLQRKFLRKQVFLLRALIGSYLTRQTSESFSPELKNWVYPWKKSLLLLISMAIPLPVYYTHLTLP